MSYGKGTLKRTQVRSESSRSCAGQEGGETYKAIGDPQEACPKSPELSVVVATRNRACQLERMLTSIEQQTLNRDEVLVIVVENGSTDNTKDILQRKARSLNILPLWEGVANKARALNRALSAIVGELVVFADDDITGVPNWLRALRDASIRFPSAAVFCGPIIPAFPAEAPEWLRNHPVFSRLFFGKFDPGTPEGPLPEPLAEEDFPYGANFAARTRDVKCMRFRERLGPSDRSGPLYDEDTEFLTRLHAQFPHFVFVPDARVVHHVEAPQVEWSALFEKAFHFGRTAAIRKRSPTSAPPPSHSFHEDAATIETFEKGCLLNFYIGQLQEFRRRRQKECEVALENLLQGLNLNARNSLLSKSARVFGTAY